MTVFLEPKTIVNKMFGKHCQHVEFFYILTLWHCTSYSHNAQCGPQNAITVIVKVL